VQLPAPRFPSRAVYVCREGYNASGLGPNLTRTSTADGEWAGEEPRCLGLALPVLLNTSEYEIRIHSDNPEPSQRVLHDTPRYPSVAHHFCRAGWNSSAHGPYYTRSSTTDGQWAGRVPTCHGQVLQALRSTLNYTLVVRTLPGHKPSQGIPETAVRCWQEPSTALVVAVPPKRTGPRRLQERLLAPGSYLVAGLNQSADHPFGWNASVVRGVAMRAGRYVPNRTLCEHSGFRFPAAVNVTCREGYNSSGPGPTVTRTATVFGDWAGIEPACIGVELQPLGDPPVNGFRSEVLNADFGDNRMRHPGMVHYGTHAFACTPTVRY
jgi:hypothetical protein